MLTSSRMINMTLLIIKGHFLPYRSAAMPNRMEPTAIYIFRLVRGIVRGHLQVEASVKYPPLPQCGQQA